MPWDVRTNGNEYCVYKKGSDAPVKGGCHANRADAIKHMRALYANEPTSMKYSALTFSEDLLEETDDPNTKWVQAWRYSIWNHPVYGQIEITPQMGSDFKQHFDQRTLGRDHLISYEHGEDAAKGGKAAGTILDIDPREDAIYYKVQFTDNALQEIKAGEWRYLSPEFNEWYVDTETGETYENMPFDLALTNVPFFRGMAPLNFSEVYDEKSMDFSVWTTAYINNLPDSSFLFIEAGGEKDSEGKTVPRSLRHLPVKDANGKADEAHVRNAIQRAPQVKGLSAEKAASLQEKARKMLSEKSKGGKEVDELLKKFALRLGVELGDDADEDTVLKAADKLNEAIEPLRKSKEDGERARTFREAFPKEYERIKKLEAAQVDTDAMAFSQNYNRFTIRDGENEWKSVLGFSQLVIEKITEVHKKFSERTVEHSDLKELLDLIGDKGIVDFSEYGSSRGGHDKPRSEDPKLAFSEAVQEVMEKDNLEYEDALHQAAAKYPDMYEAYVKAIPQR